MTRIDVHQHLLSAPLIDALERRSDPPALRRTDGGWTFQLIAEPESFLPNDAVDAEARVGDMEADEVDRGLVALSTALGIESLPAAEAAPLLDAYLDGLDELPSSFGGWAAVGLADPDPGAVDAALARGCVGLSLPAGSLGSPAALERVGPLLERLEAHDAPLFVHPGPVTGGPGAAAVPGWWPALTDYVAQMNAAWFAFLDSGRRAHSRLRVLFAMLAGGAPLHLERFSLRSGEPTPSPDPDVFYDTSSYGPRMLAAMVAAVGSEQLVYGSDRPVVDPGAPRADTDLGHALLTANPGRLLSPNPKGDTA